MIQIHPHFSSDKLPDRDRAEPPSASTRRSFPNDFATLKAFIAATALSESERRDEPTRSEVRAGERILQRLHAEIGDEDDPAGIALAALVGERSLASRLVLHQLVRGITPLLSAVKRSLGGEDAVRTFQEALKTRRLAVLRRHSHIVDGADYRAQILAGAAIRLRNAGETERSTLLRGMSYEAWRVIYMYEHEGLAPEQIVAAIAERVRRGRRCEWGFEAGDRANDMVIRALREIRAALPAPCPAVHR